MVILMDGINIIFYWIFYVLDYLPYFAIAFYL